MLVLEQENNRMAQIPSEMAGVLCLFLGGAMLNQGL